MRPILLLCLAFATICAASAVATDETPLRRVPPPKTPPPPDPGLERSIPRAPDATARRVQETIDLGGSLDDDLPVMPRGEWSTGGSLVYEEQLILDCGDVRICALDPLDAYAAWMLAAQTTFPWRVIVDARLEADSWAEAFVELDVAPWEVYAAFDLGTDARRLPTDAGLEEIARRHLGEIKVPTWRCRFPVELQGVSVEEIARAAGRILDPLDGIDEGIAARIADETGWCERALLDARRFLGSWPRVARQLYLSPFLFEASFGIRLSVQPLGVTQRVRYPREEEIRAVVEGERWPEVGRN